MTIRGSDAVDSTINSMPFSTACGSNIWLTSCTNSSRSKGSSSSDISSASIFDRSSTLLMTPSNARPANWIFVRN
jgi:hypothetical protein